MEKFDSTVKQLTSPEIYDAYHKIVLDHLNGLTSVSFFRVLLYDLFRGYPEIHDELNRFFRSNEKAEN